MKALVNGEEHELPHWMTSRIESEARRLAITELDMIKILLADALDRRDQ